MMMETQLHEHKRFQHNVAMTVTLVSFGMLFATLFLGYLLVRFNSAVWPPQEIESMPKLLPFVSTLVIALSSLSYYWFRTKKKRSGLTGAFIVGCAFLGCQWQLWSELKANGILAANGQVSSMVYGFSWLHAAHIVLGLAALTWLMFKEWSEFAVLNVGKFWDFLAVVWFLIYFTLFLV